LGVWFFKWGIFLIFSHGVGFGQVFGGFWDFGGGGGFEPPPPSVRH